MWLRQKNPLQAQPRTKINMRMHIRFINIGPNSNSSNQFITNLLQPSIPLRYWKTGRTLLLAPFKNCSGQMLGYVIFTDYYKLYRYLIKFKWFWNFCCSIIISIFRFKDCPWNTWRYLGIPRFGRGWYKCWQRR